ncbi:MAG: CvpA family protein [Bacteroidetes bacterium]|nr:CvpA family protein [Bacteroidota bacterium]
MNFLDYILIIILALFAILGFRKGIIVSVVTVAALIIGIYAAVHFSNYIDATLMENLKPSRKWLPFISFSITFIIVLVVVLLAGKLVEKLVDITGLGFVNRLFGAIFGIIKGVILASVLFFIVVAIDHNGKWLTAEHKKGSYFYTQVSRVFPELMKRFGKEIKFPNW